MNNYIFKVTIPLCASILFASPLSISQPNEGDLSIYSSELVSGDTSADGRVKPNLLFIADNSQSMHGLVAVNASESREAYDPSIDYGSANNDDIYVYSDRTTFSGVVIESDQNKCDALTTTINNSPDYPRYVGKALQWQTDTNFISSTIETCEGDSDLENETHVSDTITRTAWTNIVYPGRTGENFEESLFQDGTIVTVTLVNNSEVDEDDDDHAIIDGGIWYRLGSSAGGPYTTNLNACRFETNPEGAESCSIVIGSGDIGNNDGRINEEFFALRTPFRRKNGSSGNVDYKATLTIEHPEATCTITTEVTEQNYSEWSDSLITSSDSGAVLECEDDSGIHGLTNSSDPYVQYCGSSSDCASARYVSSGGIDWDAQGLEDKYFYTGNYHDYLEYETVIPESEIYNSRETYDYYRTHNNNTTTRGTPQWQSFTNRTVSQFCTLLRQRSIIATDRDDPSTYSESYTPPLSVPVYVRDGNDAEGTVYVCRHKANLMINALEDIVSVMTDVNMGVMTFNLNNSHHGGSVFYHVQDMDVQENKDGLLEEVADLLPNPSRTPLAETMFEAYRYLDGGEVYSGKSETDANALSGSTYNSPITHSCQASSILYLTDGAPYRDEDLNTPIEALVGECNTPSGADNVASNSCFDDLAAYMANNDIGNQVGINTVNTHTIGFNLNLALLDDVATAGQGEYYSVVSYDDLLGAFEDVVDSLSASESTTLVAPAVSVNAFNELQHRDQIYYATFTPALEPRWEGNVKKYGISSDGTVFGQGDSSSSVIGLDGQFTNTAQSFWSDNADGANVEEGGYREQLTNNRPIYVDSGILSSGSGNGIELLTSSKSFDPTATGFNSLEVDTLRDWLLGVDVDDINEDDDYTDAHFYGADSLHSKPFVITFKGTSTADAEDVLFVTNNLGMITAVDARDDQGTELWSYLPSDLIGNIKTYRENNDNLRHYQAYGIDGEATIWTTEEEGSTNFNVETAYMYQGMRRGGRNYYAFDVSNADLENASALPISNLWGSGPIIGGAGGTPGFEDLGYTWSKMVRTKIRWNCSYASQLDGCETRDVLVFSGGYDGTYDNNSLDFYDANSVSGDAVYIVDALTGSLLWSAGNSSDGHTLTVPMYNSVPGDPSVIDIDGDGDLDILYVVDISGKVFRFDFDQTHSGFDTGYATGGLIANLTNNSDIRRFYNGLDVSLQQGTDGFAFLALSVGSGYRAGPKEEESWENRFYVIIDENLSQPIDENDSVNYNYVFDSDSSSYSVITESDLHAYTSSDPFVRGAINTDGSVGDNGENGEYGFYRSFSQFDYEKILQSSITFDGKILVASYLPSNGGDQTDSDNCGTVDIGGGRIYQFDILTGESTLSVDHDGDASTPDELVEYIDTASDGIPTEPAILLLPGEIVTCFGTECRNDLIDYDVGNAVKTYWQEQ